MDTYLIAHPMGDVWVVTCSLHGTMGTVTDATVDSFLASHMTEHGAMAVA